MTIISDYYKKNKTRTQITYRAFFDRVKSKKYKTLEEALTTPPQNHSLKKRLKSLSLHNKLPHLKLLF